MNLILIYYIFFYSKTMVPKYLNFKLYIK